VTTQEIERRYTRGNVEVRAVDGGMTIGGYAAKYDKLSRDLGGFVERIDAGFFTKSLADNLDVLARYNHDDNRLLGRTASGTLRLLSDEVGLDYTVDLPDTTVGRDLSVLTARGDVYQSSFAFRVLPEGDEWALTEQGFPVRTLLRGVLYDVAPVNSPAYLDTTSGLRSLAEAHDTSVEEVQAMAARNELSRLLSVPPVVIDLAGGGQGETHPPTRQSLHAEQAAKRARADLDAKRLRS
jgi:HK97 family phage prohead protease